MEDMITAIRVLMLSRGEKQKELGKAVGLPEQSISQKLNGHRKFTIEEVRRIFRHYDITPDELYAIFME